MPPYPVLVLALLAATATEPPQINPVPPAILSETLTEWTFDEGTDGWVAEQHCQVAAEAGLLQAVVTTTSPANVRLLLEQGFGASVE